MRPLSGSSVAKNCYFDNITISQQLVRLHRSAGVLLAGDEKCKIEFTHPLDGI
jgi:hypothetical protein